MYKFPVKIFEAGLSPQVKGGFSHKDNLIQITSIMTYITYSLVFFLALKRNTFSPEVLELQFKMF